MRAWVLHDIGDIRMEEAAQPRPGRGEVLAAVKAAGICGSDIPRIFRTGAHVHPLIPGHEFSGVVARCGADVDAKWEGKRVGIFPLIPCGVCAPCRGKRYEMCRNYGYLGSRRDGGFAEYAAVPADNLLELPQGVSFEEAAMLEPMAVAAHAMRRTAPKASDTVAVCGLGTIGLALLMLLLEAGSGAKILAVGNKEFQRRKALELGLPEDCCLDSKTRDAGKWLMERTDGLGADVFFECVGKCETLALAVDCAAAAGKVCLVGNPASDMRLDRDVYWKILRNQLTLTGTWNSSFTHGRTDDWQYVLERLAGGKIAPARLISHRLSMEEMGRGFCLMRDKSEDYGKVMGCF